MKVKITEDSKRVLTLADMPAARKIIKDLMEDNYIKEYGGSCARIASGQNESFEILKAEAELCKNCRVWNYYSDDSGNLDVLITFYAFNPYYGFYSIEACLSDIWQIGSAEANQEVKSHMYIREYKLVK
jgi:hypothetical protein